MNVLIDKVRVATFYFIWRWFVLSAIFGRAPVLSADQGTREKIAPPHPVCELPRPEVQQ